MLNRFVLEGSMLSQGPPLRQSWPLHLASGTLETPQSQSPALQISMQDELALPTLLRFCSGARKSVMGYWHHREQDVRRDGDLINSIVLNKLHDPDGSGEDQDK
jgi:hypothetical protein